MISINSFSDIDQYYKNWNKRVSSKGILYTCPPELGKGYMEIIGDLNTIFITITDYVEYHPLLTRGYTKEKMISIAEVQSGSGYYYRNKSEMGSLENGINCRINAVPTVLYSKMNDNTVVRGTGFVIREAFLQTLSINQYTLELMAYYFNNHLLYNHDLLFIFKQLNHLPVTDDLIPLYLKAKAVEVISLLSSLALESKGKPRVTKDTMQNIKLVIEFLDNHYIDPPKIEKLTTMFFINKKLLQTGFKNLTGRTVYEYITYQKINHAVDLLLSTNMTIEAIAHKMGYRSKMNFYNAFKKELLMTPNQLRKKYKRISN